ncbi:MAG: hypothetical protein LBN19_03445 [Endomicrobium sp.]|nr:hypothetical protein [Endomicrobium sp.]
MTKKLITIILISVLLIAAPPQEAQASVIAAATMDTLFCILYNDKSEMWLHGNALYRL